MSDRKFGQINFQEAGRPVTARPIICAECGTQDIFRLTDSASQSVRMATVYFERRGWVIGRKAAKDLCPACRDVKRQEHQERRALREARPAKEMAVMKPKTTPNLAVAEPPREATRENKQLIHMKLAEVYIEKPGGAGHYERGWSDEKLARDLGVPRAWVSQIRKDFFGEGEGGEDVAELLVKVDALRLDVEKATSAANAATAACESVLARMREIERETKPLRALVPA